MTERNILFYETNGYNPISVGWKKYAGNDPDVQIVYDTARYIQNNVCSTDLSIGVLADRISVSRFRLVRAFAKVKNMPPMEFVIQKPVN